MWCRACRARSCSGPESRRSLRRSNASDSLRTTADLPGIGIFHFHIETPDPPDTPDDPRTPNTDESINRVGSYADWYEISWNPQQQTREPRTPHGPPPPHDPPGGDCGKLVAIVEDIANSAANADDFIKALVAKVIGNLDVNSYTDFDKANNLRGANFGDSGFKSQFQDGSNQVRHFTGGLWAGYLFGPGVAQLGMNSNEDSTIVDGRGVVGSAAGILPTLFPKDSSKADVALNSVSIPLGVRLTPVAAETRDVGDRGGWRKIPGHPGYKGLAAAIASQVCD